MKWGNKNKNFGNNAERRFESLCACVCSLMFGWMVGVDQVDTALDTALAKGWASKFVVLFFMFVFTVVNPLWRWQCVFYISYKSTLIFRLYSACTRLRFLSFLFFPCVYLMCIMIQNHDTWHTYNIFDIVFIYFFTHVSAYEVLHVNYIMSAL